MRKPKKTKPEGYSMEKLAWALKTYQCHERQITAEELSKFIKN